MSIKQSQAASLRRHRECYLRRAERLLRKAGFDTDLPPSPAMLDWLEERGLSEERDALQWQMGRVGKMKFLKGLNQG